MVISVYIMLRSVFGVTELWNTTLPDLLHRNIAVDGSGLPKQITQMMTSLPKRDKTVRHTHNSTLPRL